MAVDMDVSPHGSMDELKALDGGQVNSPDRRRAKKRRQHVAGDRSTRNN